jgi:CrcB protein
MRHGLSTWARQRLALFFPFGTLLANLIGCLLIGLLMSYYAQGRLAEGLRLAAVVGLLGGFTTYSSFAFETFDMLRDGSVGPALAYVVLSIVLGLLFVYLGWALAGGAR